MGRCDRLKWNRKKLGMTQKELADKIGVGVSTISKLETDETAWATVRASTDDAIDGVLRNLGSWQCDPETVFNKKDIKVTDELHKQLRKKRLELGLTQLALSKIIGIHRATISNYENRSGEWNNKNNNNVISSRLIDFINGKYDDTIASKQVQADTNVTEKPELLSERREETGETVEKALNNIIDILQEKLSLSTGKNTKKYVSMIAGVCNGYLHSEC